MAYKKITCDGKEFNLVPIDMSNLRIIVLDKGFVYVGNYIDKGETIIIENARCIRYWGTKRGLAQLANDGPTSETKLDEFTTIEAPKSALIHTLLCTEGKWNIQ